MCICQVAHHTCFLSRQSDVSSFFCLARVVCRRVFEVTSKFEEMMDFFYEFKAYFRLKYKYCVSYISWPLQDLNEAVSSMLWPVLKIFFVLVVKTKSWVRGCVLSLQHSFFWSEVFVYHDSPSINSSLSSTLHVYRREEIRRKKNASSDVITSSLYLSRDTDLVT